MSLCNKLPAAAIRLQIELTAAQLESRACTSDSAVVILDLLLHRPRCWLVVTADTSVCHESLLVFTMLAIVLCLDKLQSCTDSCSCIETSSKQSSL